MKCLYCEEALRNSGPIEVHHIHPTAQGGPDIAGNRLKLHRDCHDAVHLAVEYARSKQGGFSREPWFWKMTVLDVLEHCDNPRFEAAIPVIKALTTQNLGSRKPR